MPPILKLIKDMKMITDIKLNKERPADGGINAIVGSSSLKVYVLTLSKNFMSTHSKAGQKTEFFDKIKSGEKIHTIRGNYELWKKRIDEIQKGKAILSIREWSDKPYRSPQMELMQLTKVGIQKIQRDVLGWFIDDIDSDYKMTDFAKNDGLDVRDFAEWFKHKGIKEPMAIIHFTNFRY